MIRRLRGVLLSAAEGRVEVMTGMGVGYELLVPTSLLSRLPAEGETVELHTALVVRDEALELYGFEAARDRELFLRLQEASGVGPRLALAILGSLSGPRVVRAIRGKEPQALQVVSGVGRKTAERIVLELSDKLEALAAEMPEPETEAPEAAAAGALRALGYAHLEAEKAVSRARRELTGRDVSTEELIRAALQHL